MLEAAMGLGNFPKAFNSTCIDLLAEDVLELWRDASNRRPFRE